MSAGWGTRLAFLTGFFVLCAGSYAWADDWGSNSSHGILQSPESEELKVREAPDLDANDPPLRRRKWSEQFAVNNTEFKNYVERLRREALNLGFKDHAISVDGPIIKADGTLFVSVRVKKAYLPK